VAAELEVKLADPVVAEQGVLENLIVLLSQVHIQQALWQQLTLKLLRHVLLILSQSVQVDHLLTHHQLLQTQQRLEFLQLEEDKELKNGTQDNVQGELEDLEAVEEPRPDQLTTLLEVVMQEDTLHLKENLAVVEQEVPAVLFMEQGEEAEEP
jgi:hypothetical protein